MKNTKSNNLITKKISQSTNFGESLKNMYAVIGITIFFAGYHGPCGLRIALIVSTSKPRDGIYTEGEHEAYMGPNLTEGQKRKYDF